LKGKAKGDERRRKVREEGKATGFYNDRSFVLGWPKYGCAETILL